MITKEMAEITHIAKDQIEIGLEHISKEEAKETYTRLVALQVEFYHEFIKPYVKYLSEESENGDVRLQG